MIKLNFDLEPVAKGRPRFTRQGHAFTPPKTRRFEAMIADLARGAYMGTPLAGPLAVDVTFFLRAPKKRVRTFPSIKPDVENLAKSLLDALNGIVWQDDSLIVELHARKVYASGAGHIAMEVVSV